MKKLISVAMVCVVAIIAMAFTLDKGPKTGTSVGDIAPEISLKDPEGLQL